jgi:hypothetical protein
MFTNLPREFFIPPKTEVIFVQDFFAKELIGGAELTSDAIIKACPRKLFELHSQSITEAMIQKHRDKLWVFGNQTQVAPHLLQMFIDLDIQYYFFEYDFKPCVMRSTKKHEMSPAGKCDCHNILHGKFLAHWMTKARILFWCSDGQRDKFYNLYPHLKGQTRDFTQSSTFYPETILNIRKIRERKERGEIQVLDRWVILDSDSWIKGTSDAVSYCKERNMSYVLLKNLTNEQFLEELAKSKGLVFFPRDMDVGSRITTETKLLGGNPIVNDQVLHATEAWFNRDVPEIEDYLLDGPSRFWRAIEKSL